LGLELTVVNLAGSLTPEERARGVYAASAGNHAQGVSYHAGRLGIASTIFMYVPLLMATGS